MITSNTSVLAFPYHRCNKHHGHSKYSTPRCKPFCRSLLSCRLFSWLIHSQTNHYLDHSGWGGCYKTHVEHDASETQSCLLRKRNAILIFLFWRRPICNTPTSGMNWWHPSKPAESMEQLTYDYLAGYRSQSEKGGSRMTWIATFL